MKRNSLTQHLHRSYPTLQNDRLTLFDKPVSLQVAGLDTRAENLPVDLAGALDDALRQGRVREALALLLRDTLVTFFRRHPTPLTPGATEQDCLRAYRRLLGDTPAVVYLERLTEAWTRTAWAHRPSTPEQVQALYDQWRGLRPAEAKA